MLNRELQSSFQLVVRATAKRRKSNTLEASTIVNLTVADENDNAPMFSQMKYALQVDARVCLLILVHFSYSITTDCSDRPKCQTSPTRGFRFGCWLEWGAVFLAFEEPSNSIRIKPLTMGIFLRRTFEWLDQNLHAHTPARELHDGIFNRGPRLSPPSPA